ncbi:pulmonary surfactant-associated protein B isoform X2 [Chroicocephalus ridibundus]|uniref:pulmonary surfactant-associated protein B isoform X2 n=1 Tax=Chroicocephalus ridibundus TaxID=1192867 RepID=UPI002FDD67FD
MAPPPSPALTLLLALLCATPGLGVLGGRCGAPPSAWCQSWETALRCGALGHCARAVWAPPGTDICADCQQIITLLIHMANESATKVAVEGFLRRECAALPVPTMVPPCQNLVHEYFSLLLTDLEGHLKPSAVCARLDLCPGKSGGGPAVLPLGTLSARLQVAAREALPMPLPLCWLCRTFLARAEAAVPKEGVAAAAAGLCRVLPAVVAGACQCLAQRYAVLALEAVLGRLGPHLLCHLLLACRSEDGYGLLSPPGRPLDDTAAPPAACASGEELAPGHPLPVLSPNPGPCILGPSYWCSSPEAARRCQVSWGQGGGQRGQGRGGDRPGARLAPSSPRSVLPQALQHCREHVWA